MVLDLRHLIRSGYKFVAGKLGPFRAVKTGLGERPKKRGSPEKLELRRIIIRVNIQDILSVASNNHHSNDLYYIACAVTSNTW
jgi:hypothetical protein